MNNWISLLFIQYAFAICPQFYEPRSLRGVSFNKLANDYQVYEFRPVFLENDHQSAWYNSMKLILVGIFYFIMSI
jgi:hypothetical protein